MSITVKVLLVVMLLFVVCEKQSLPSEKSEDLF